MSNEKNISLQVIRRLPRYHRFLGDLMEQGIDRISSKRLAELMGVTASQIRQDLNCFGGFGMQGYGYPVPNLYLKIGQILGLDSQYPAILLGAGNLGRAVASHMSFEKRGFRLIGIFDNDPQKTGETVRDLNVMSDSEIENFCSSNTVKAAILCVPKAEAARLAERLYSLGIKCFWNFSHYDLSSLHEDITVENVHLNDSLMTLCYKMSNAAENCSEDEK